MLQFMNGSDAAYAALERSAQGACVQFRDQPMPRGTVPERARVGFEVLSDGGAVLLVDKGVGYTGSSTSVRQWFTDGRLGFPSFNALRTWIQGELRSCYGDARQPDGLAPQPQPDELTDLRAATAELPKANGAVPIDEGRLFSELTGRIRGQDDAMRFMARGVRRHLARRNPRRPLTLFALGQTGVGKTASAEYLPVALARLLPNGPAYRYLRLDMSEYQERHRVSQLLGAPQGYIGYGEGAQLTEVLRANGRSVVLFDEIEKAHPDILRALMNAMDAGRLSTPSATTGREIDCRQAIFVFTSNLETSGIVRELETRRAFADRQAVDSVCRTQLRAAGVAPELVGRINSFLVFRPLTDRVRAEVIALAIHRVGAEYGVNIGRIAPSVVADVLKASPTQDFGVRPDEYLIDDLLGACFADAAANGMDAAFLVQSGQTYGCIPIEHLDLEVPDEPAQS